jgi:hypothetical protein
VLLDVVVMVSGLFFVQVVFVLLSAQQRVFELIEGIVQVLIVVSELGSQGNHILQSTSKVRFFKIVVDLFNHQLSLVGLGGNGESTL